MDGDRSIRSSVGNGSVGELAGKSSVTELQRRIQQLLLSLHRGQRRLVDALGLLELEGLDT